MLRRDAPLLCATMCIYTRVGRDVAHRLETSWAAEQLQVLCCESSASSTESLLIAAGHHTGGGRVYAIHSVFAIIQQSLPVCNTENRCTSDLQSVYRPCSPIDRRRGSLSMIALSCIFPYLIHVRSPSLALCAKTCVTLTTRPYSEDPTIYIRPSVIPVTVILRNDFFANIFSKIC